MVNVKKVTVLLLAMIMILAMSSLSFADGENSSGGIDSVLVLLEDGSIVSVPIDDYVQVFLLGNGSLYDFLVNSSGNIEIYGVVSGDKYISIDDYVEEYIYNPDTALEEAKPIPVDEVEDFGEVIGVDEETGEVELKPGDPNPKAYVTATFKASPAISFMGFVEVTPFQIANPAKYTVTYKLADGRIETTTMMLFGQTEDLPLVFYNETIRVSVYDANNKLIKSFNNVELVK